MFLVACYKVYNEEIFLPASIKTIYNYVDAILVNISTIPWGYKVPEDQPSPLHIGAMDSTFGKLIDLRRQGFDKIGIAVGEYASERDHVKDTLRKAQDYYPDMTHYLYIDADEGWRREGIERVKEIIEQNPEYGNFWAQKWCFFKNYHYRIMPPETTYALVAFRTDLNPRWAPPPNIRNILHDPKAKNFRIPPEEAMFYHFSWVRESEGRIKKKIYESTHRDQIEPNWYSKVWLAWNKDKSLRALHPTHPSCWEKAVLMSISDIPEPFRRIEMYCNEEHLCSS